jgi:hypothetical protein
VYAPWTTASGLINVKPDVPIAIAVNGVIGGLGGSFEPPGALPALWSAALPPGFFHAGANRIDLYVISGSVARPVLVPVHLQ